MNKDQRPNNKEDLEKFVKSYFSKRIEEAQRGNSNKDWPTEYSSHSSEDFRQGEQDPYEETEYTHSEFHSSGPSSSLMQDSSTQTEVQEDEDSSSIGLETEGEDGAGSGTTLIKNKSEKCFYRMYIMDSLLLYIPSLVLIAASMYSPSKAQTYGFERHSSILLSLGTMGFVLKWLQKWKWAGLYIPPLYLFFSEAMAGKWKNAFFGGCLWYCANLFLLKSTSSE